MNKRRVNKWLEASDTVLTTCGIAVEDRIDPTFRSQIASFGAAVVMGSLKAAAAFFAKQGNASVPREKLLSAMYCLVTGEHKKCAEPNAVFHYICAHDDAATKEAFLDAAIALKLAMNLFDLGKEDTADEKFESSVQ